MATTSFYTGPGRGRLDVGSWEELVAAVQAGSLTETQWVECKAAIPAAAAGANLELAKDLASLTVDGGVLVIGVKDKAMAAEHVVGTVDPLEALKDRLSSVAGQTRVQPAMHVVFGEPLPNPDGGGRYVVTGMLGALGHSSGAFASDRGQPLPTDEYLRIATASTADLWERPVTVVGGLLRNLARACGYRGDTSPLMDPETTPLW